jgi:cell division protein FtsI (penicillin-binding protein 3)
VAAPVFKQIAQKIYSETPMQEEVEFQSENVVVTKQFEGYYSKANAKYKTVPNVTNMPGMDAVSLLENLGFKVRFNGVGKVKSQSIKPGVELKKGTQIALDLS